jgi:hypothetical protein
MKGATTEDSATINSPKMTTIKPTIGVIHTFLRIRRKAQSSLMNISMTILTSFYLLIAFEVLAQYFESW